MRTAFLSFCTALLVFQAKAPIQAQTQSRAAIWHHRLHIGEGEAALKIEVCPLKYGKRWAYSFEQDDGAISVLTVTQPFFAKYQWNDAPPGVAGGANRPFVGTAAVILGSVGNGNSVSFEQIAELRKRDWGIANHSFWHSGVHWDEKLLNTPEQNRRELFWSQTFYAELIGRGRAATHFVFPNGDYNYGPFLKEYGLLAGSRTAGTSPHNLFDDKLNLLDYPRSYLDENNWIKSDDAMQGLPVAPQNGDFLIDFTHEMSSDSQSINQRRWTMRLDHISRKWGPTGDNSVWVAPSDKVVAYFLAAREAKVSINIGAEIGAKNGQITVTLPPGAPGSALTLKINGLGKKSVLQVPVGGTLYRQGDTAWLTTPMISTPGAAPPIPRLHRIYEGEVKNLVWDKPVALAGVRINRSGRLSADFALKIDAITPNGNTENVAAVSHPDLDKSWGNQLYDVLPNRAAIMARELRVTSDQGLSRMEVWAVSQN